MERRVFVMSGRKFAGNCGGSAGVNYRLYLANKKYGLLENAHHLFLDKTLDEEKTREKITKGKITKGKITKAIVCVIKKSGILFLPLVMYKQIRISKMLNSYEKKYHFSNDDRYIFHDPEVALEFVRKYRFSHTLLVYHQQGELYYEWKSMYKSKSFIVDIYYSIVERNVFSKISDIGFPSKGAYLSFKNTSKHDIQINNPLILYNGIAPPSNKVCNDTNTSGSKKIISLITVSVLNEAKGVENIPCVIRRIQDNLPDYHVIWTLIGNGSHKEEVEKKIKMYSIQEHVNWIKDYISHDSIMNMLENNMFYIILHNYSIFDFATIEAMSKGCVPILSNEVSNLELNKESNIICLRKEEDIDIIDKSFLKKIQKMKELNISVQKAYFDDYSFLKRYAEIKDM